MPFPEGHGLTMSHRRSAEHSRDTLDARLRERRREFGHGSEGAYPSTPPELQNRFSTALSNKVTLAVGEPAQGLSGWRLSHGQAKAALPIAIRGPKGLVRYADVALVSSILQDDLLNASLRKQIARETLRAYFDADRNVSAAAAARFVSSVPIPTVLSIARSDSGSGAGISAETEPCQAWQMAPAGFGYSARPDATALAWARSAPA